MLNSEFPLPELPECQATEPGITIKLGDAGSFDKSGFEIAHEWLDANGEVNCWVERRFEEYLLVFPGYVRFFVSANSSIVCLPWANCSIQTVRHLLLNQVVPRVIAARGNLVVHASAIVTENGRCYGFLGNSGYGKSTLASSFHADGAFLVSDDGILLQPGLEGISAIGGMPGIRLFPDSLQAVFENFTGFAEYTPYTQKQQMIVEQKGPATSPESYPLSAVFVLNDPGPESATMNVVIEPLGGARATAALINCAFCLDPSDRATVIGNFQKLGQLIDEHRLFYSLSYPRDLSLLNVVKMAVAAI